MLSVPFYPTTPFQDIELDLGINWENKRTQRQRALNHLQDLFPNSHIWLTNSGTAALELGFMQMNLQPGDEIILPSFNFVSSAALLAAKGCVLRFADIHPDGLCLDPEQVATLINEKTKAVVVVHYNGINPRIKALKQLCNNHGIPLIEDGAMSFGVQDHYPELLQSGEWGILSFDHTKHMNSHQGGALIWNQPNCIESIDNHFQNGTNRSSFDQGIVTHYEWVSLGAKFSMSEWNCALLNHHLGSWEFAKNQRRSLSNLLHQKLEFGEKEGHFNRAYSRKPDDHIAGYYIVLRDANHRPALVQFLKERGIEAQPHYYPLHRSSYAQSRNWTSQLPVTDCIADSLLRLPNHQQLNEAQIAHIAQGVMDFFHSS